MKMGHPVPGTGIQEHNSKVDIMIPIRILRRKGIRDGNSCEGVLERETMKSGGYASMWFFALQDV